MQKISNKIWSNSTWSDLAELVHGLVSDIAPFRDP